MGEKLEFTDDKFVLMALFRYALPRHTYAPSIAIENIKNNWNKLDEYVKKQIKSEIFDESDRIKVVGEWNEILELPIENTKKVE